MRVHLVSIFPHFFDSVLAEGVLRIAREQQQLDVTVVDPRDFTFDRHRTTDDAPYGGGVGMIMKPDPVVAAVESIGDAAHRGHVHPESRRRTHRERQLGDQGDLTECHAFPATQRARDQDAHTEARDDEDRQADDVLRGSRQDGQRVFRAAPGAEEGAELAAVGAVGRFSGYDALGDLIRGFHRRRAAYSM